LDQPTATARTAIKTAKRSRRPRSTFIALSVIRIPDFSSSVCELLQAAPRRGERASHGSRGYAPGELPSAGGVRPHSCLLRVERRPANGYSAQRAPGRSSGGCDPQVGALSWAALLGRLLRQRLSEEGDSSPSSRARVTASARLWTPSLAYTLRRCDPIV